MEILKMKKKKIYIYIYIGLITTKTSITFYSTVAYNFWGTLGRRFTIKHKKNVINIYFAQSRHHQEDTDLSRVYPNKFIYNVSPSTIIHSNWHK